MQTNVGGWDRNARFVIGAILLLVAIFAPLGTVARTILVILALVALVTAALRYCPLNAALGINTAGKPARV